jgi:hypothetical protein
MDGAPPLTDGGRTRFFAAPETCEEKARALFVYRHENGTLAVDDENREPTIRGMANDEDRFDVILKSGGGTMTVLRSVTLAAATDRASLEAKNGRVVFIKNQRTGALQKFN